MQLHSIQFADTPQIFDGVYLRSGDCIVTEELYKVIHKKTWQYVCVHNSGKS